LLSALISTRHEYDALFSIYVPIGCAVFVIIVLVVLFAVVRYRGRPLDAVARWSENNPLEISYALLLTCVAGFLLYLTYHYEHRVDTVAQRERPALTINVIAAKWEWEFIYPGSHIEHYSGTVLREPLVVPADEAIRFNLQALDVIHGFWVPNLNFKHDIIPGSPTHLTLTFTDLGLFRAQCSQFCGLRHADMVFNVRVLPAAQFAAWQRSGGRMRF
jgi:cytochrome c oxidase subunit 2